MDYFMVQPVSDQVIISIQANGMIFQTFKNKIVKKGDKPLRIKILISLFSIYLA